MIVATALPVAQTNLPIQRNKRRSPPKKQKQTGYKVSHLGPI